MILVRFEHYNGAKRSLEKQLPFEMIPNRDEFILVEVETMETVTK